MRPRPSGSYRKPVDFPFWHTPATICQNRSFSNLSNSDWTASRLSTLRIPSRCRNIIAELSITTSCWKAEDPTFMGGKRMTIRSSDSIPFPSTLLKRCGEDCSLRSRELAEARKPDQYSQCAWLEYRSCCQQVQ